MAKRELDLREVYVEFNKNNTEIERLEDSKILDELRDFYSTKGLESLDIEYQYGILNNYLHLIKKHLMSGGTVETIKSSKQVQNFLELDRTSLKEESIYFMWVPNELEETFKIGDSLLVLSSYKYNKLGKVDSDKYRKIADAFGKRINYIKDKLISMDFKYGDKNSLLDTFYKESHDIVKDIEYLRGTRLEPSSRVLEYISNSR